MASPPPDCPGPRSSGDHRQTRPRSDRTAAAGARMIITMRELANLVRGCTFDDFLFVPQQSVLERRYPSTIDLSSRLSEHITLRRPLVSANMDTVTRSA